MTVSASTNAFQRPDLGMAFEGLDLDREAMRFKALEIFPVLRSMVANASFSVHPPEELQVDSETLRNPDGSYQRSNSEVDQLSFLCVEHGHEERVDDANKAIFAYSFDAEMIAAKRVRNKILRKLERDLAAKLFNATTWTGAALTTAVSTKWTVSATATPIKDVLAAIQKVRASCGDEPNALILSYDTFLNLQSVAQIKNQVVYNGADDPKKVTEQQLAALFHVDKVIVCRATQNTVNKAQGYTGGSIWRSDYAMVAKLATSMDLSEACVGRTFHHILDGAGDVIVETYRDEARRSDIVRCRLNYDQKIIEVGSAHLLQNLS